MNFYRPQTKFRGKVMFLHLCHSVHRGEGVCPTPNPLMQTPPDADPPGFRPPWDADPPDADPPGMQTHPRGWADPPGCRPSGFRPPWDADPPDADPPGMQTHPRGWADPPRCRPPRPRYSQQAGGTHPTLMHTCSICIQCMYICLHL